MSTSRYVTTLLAVLSCFCLANVASAQILGDPRLGPLNTGVNLDGILLPDASPPLGDINYQLVLSADFRPCCNGPQSFVVPANSNLFNSSWLPNGPNSNWISPNRRGATAFFPNIAGNYQYQTSFIVPPECATNSVVINGQWWVDDSAVGIQINGVPAPQNNLPTGNFIIPTNFVINSNIQSGNNTLDFIVTNNGGPTGLRVEFGVINALCLTPDLPPTQVSNWVPNVGHLAPAEQPLGDMWTFTCPANGTVKASVDTKDDDDASESGIDPVLLIVDGQGNLLAQGDDQVGCTYSPGCFYACPQVVNVPCGSGSTHSIIVRDFGSYLANIGGASCNTGGGYELILEVNDDTGVAISPNVGGGPSRSVPGWAVNDGKAEIGPALDDENVPTFGEAVTK